MEVFRRQAAACPPYAEYLSLIECDPTAVDSPEKIPYLPIGLFKTRDVYCGSQPPEIVFTSSTTGGEQPARHMMQSVADYERVFTAAFEQFYGPAAGLAIFALLPGYLERKGSSLVYMADKLIRASGRGGFFLHDHAGLLAAMAACPGPKILLGVSYALWDLAEKHPGPLHDTIIMETGGMKGNREELPREQFHKILCDAFGVDAIHSEYGMAELTSQAYSSGGGVFRAPAWMRVSARDLNDPFAPAAAGGINIADLANLTSCAFIQTSDRGTVFADGSFTIAGRIAGSDIRGCNLLVQ
ncbi:MAG: acyltransferase [Rikenellaceae bacterium]|nr:acyltransferase [Rikenellaceae bacterium]